MGRLKIDILPRRESWSWRQVPCKTEAARSLTEAASNPLRVPFPCARGALGPSIHDSCLKLTCRHSATAMRMHSILHMHCTPARYATQMPTKTPRPPRLQLNQAELRLRTLHLSHDSCLARSDFFIHLHHAQLEVGKGKCFKMQ